MAVKPSAAVAAAAATLALLAFAAPAQAELQTWRLTAQSYYVRAGSIAPALAEVGNSFTIDYVIESQQEAREDFPGLFDGAIKSFTINGVKSQAEGYVFSSTESGLNGIYTYPSDSRNDGIDFISFYNDGESSSADVASTLKLLSMFASSDLTVLRVEFGMGIIVAKPSSFVMTSPVPEPSAAWLLLMGLPWLALKRNRPTSARPSPCSP